MAHRFGVTGIGTDGVKVGTTNREDQLIILVRQRLIKKFEHLIAVAGDRESYGDGSPIVLMVRSGEG